MTLKLVDEDEGIMETIIPSFGVSKIKNKCVLVTNLKPSRKNQGTKKFWIKNQAERKEKFKEYLADLLI